MAKKSHTPKRSVDCSLFLDPFDNVELLSYFHDIAKWHGFVRFLGLPHLQESPDQPLQELYVEPFLSRRSIHIDEPPEKWSGEAAAALEIVGRSERLVVLGDPGSGKSTLVSWIAWQLSRPETNSWRRRLGPLVPLPLVLRELNFDARVTAESLLAAFLAHPVAEKLRSTNLIENLLERGQAFLLLDGLDEIGNIELRQALRDAVFDFSRRHENCRFMLTSRIVGYEQVRFHEISGEVAGEDTDGVLTPHQQTRPWSDLCYVAPFTSEQIEQFARNWYARREAVETLSNAGAGDLVRAVHGSESTLRLARNPNLLTLMALVHRVQRRLPHGRALLFEKIAEAYLESIDVFRGIHEVDYTLIQKKRWLAYVGFQMQLRRGEEISRGYREVLVDQSTVSSWVKEAMQLSTGREDSDAANRFVDYIGRRSGLLLPRGQELFAFTHLSFQEYFAAFYLSEQVTSPLWLSAKPTKSVQPAALREYANRVTWRETMLLLFELLAERPDWLEELTKQIFGHDFGLLLDQTGSQDARVELLAEIAADPHAGLSRNSRLAAWKACWLWQLQFQENEKRLDVEPVFARKWVAGQGDDSNDFWMAFNEALQKLSPRRLTLRNTPITDLGPLLKASSLEYLDLRNTSVSDVSALTRLRKLKYLYLNNSPVSDIGPLARLTNLKSLDLRHTPVASLPSLADLKALRYLFLGETNVSDLSPLSRLSGLQTLDLHGTKVSDISALCRLSELRVLNLKNTPVADVSPLSVLPHLETLEVDGTSVAGLGVLQEKIPRLVIVF